MVAVGAASLLSRVRAADWHAADNPFRLGVASGFPTDRSVVLWTRVAPDPLAPDGGMPPADVDVQWEIATDEAFTRNVRSGTTQAILALGHSARVEVQGLSPARQYWYRFIAGGQRSAKGRTRTLPATGSRVAELHLAVACCQHYEHGRYAALKYMAADAPDAIVHLGDYIYEGAPVHNRARAHVGNLCRTLEDYRLRYSQYQLDPSLQAAHAAAPWLCTWDDHEVANDYAGLDSGRNEDPAVFLARRTAAYQAYFEHLPLPPSAAPLGSETPIFARRRVGDLASFHLLDQRQYRSAPACQRPGRSGGNRSDANCTDLILPQRTMLGAAQEAWLDQGLASDPATWTFIAQGTVMSHLDEKSGEGRAYSTDCSSTARRIPWSCLATCTHSSSATSTRCPSSSIRQPWPVSSSSAQSPRTRDRRTSWMAGAPRIRTCRSPQADTATCRCVSRQDDCTSISSRSTTWMIPRQAGTSCIRAWSRPAGPGFRSPEPKRAAFRLRRIGPAALKQPLQAVTPERSPWIVCIP
jgi:alkaline phosphatase D